MGVKSQLWTVPSDLPTNAQLAGQRLMVGFEGTELNADLRFLIDSLKVGGIILFSINLAGPNQIKKLCDGIQAYACECRQPPLLIAIDQEGGQVARLKAPFTQFDGNPAMGGKQDAADFARICANELAQVGINMNLAPVLDVNCPGVDSVMARRSFGDTPQWVSSLGVTVIEQLQSRKIMAVAKHFPGIGRTTADSHHDRPILDTASHKLGNHDILPFKAAIEHRVAGMMLSHVVYSKIDSQWPASLSPTIVRSWLRQRLGYRGVVMTDDLDMGAIKKHYSLVTVMEQIVAADIDMALICHKGPDIQQGFELLLRTIMDDPAAKQMGLCSFERILALKRHYLLR
jgi:beta-N-acetylhexosaminidase